MNKKLADLILKRHRKKQIAVIIISFELISSSFATVTSISSQIQLQAHASAGNFPSQDFENVSQTTTLNELSTSVSAQDFQVVIHSEFDSQVVRATAQSSMSATWNSASSGQFNFDTILSSGDLSAFQNTGVYTGSPGISYTFSSDVPANLTLNYSNIYTGSSLFSYSMLQFIQVSSDGQNSQSFFSAPTGSFSYSINPGQDYTINLTDDSNLFNLLAFSSEENGTVNFQITDVPEPKSYLVFCTSAVAYFAQRTRKRETVRLPVNRRSQPPLALCVPLSQRMSSASRA